MFPLHVPNCPTAIVFNSFTNPNCRVDFTEIEIFREHRHTLEDYHWVETTGGALN